MGKAIDFIKKVSKDLHIEKDERETESEWVTRVAYSASIQSAVASLCDTTVSYTHLTLPTILLV